MWTLYNLEFLIFSIYERKLHWTTVNSPLSRHILDRKGTKEDFFKTTKLPLDQIEERVRNENMYTSIDPVREGDSKKFVDKARTSSKSQKKIFTLIDTYTMTVTLFEAVRPPIAVVLCGDEKGHAASVAVFAKLNKRHATVPRNGAEDGISNLG